MQCLDIGSGKFSKNSLEETSQEEQIDGFFIGFVYRAVGIVLISTRPCNILPAAICTMRKQQWG